MDVIGNYNPHLPRILGQEWVPIRDEDLTYSQAVNNVERGHRFTTGAAVNLGEAKFYLHKFPPGFVACQVYTAAVYPADRIDKSGPIRSVLIPCNNGGITGSGISLVNATTVAEALADGSDDKFVSWAPGSGVQDDISMFFALNQYAQLLNGKRILAVNILYSAGLVPGQAETSENRFTSAIGEDTDPNRWFYPSPFNDNPLGPGHNFESDSYNTIKIGDTNLFFTSPTTMNETIPWTYTQLQRFEASAASRIFFHIRSLSSAANDRDYTLDYVALQVFFCDEQRVSYGSLMVNSISTAERFFTMGQNGITMRSLTGVTVPSLPSGDYYLTLAESSTGDLIQSQINLGRQPLLNSIRQLYPIPPHKGVELRIPTPITDGEVFQAAEVDTLPQLSLHTSVPAVMPEVHVYGRQAVAQVYGLVTATQEIADGTITAASYPQVRFYARRFGNTVVPLKLTSTTFPTSIVSITPIEHDQLDEIVDGWKEVTLTFPIAPTFGSTAAKFTWSATGETAGNRWEILGAVAPALSGIPGNMLNLAPANAQLYESTYLAPTGSAAELEWVPQGVGSPWVSGNGTDDDSSDAVIIFSQNMPTVTGMAVTVLSQAVTGIGQNCGINPIFIPSQIQYNRLTWPFQSTDVGLDFFTRTVAAGGWGTSTTNQAWTVNPPADFSVNGNEGLVSFSGAFGIPHTAIMGATTFLDVKGSYRISSSTVAASGEHWGGLWVRGTGGTASQVYTRVNFDAAGSVSLYLVSELTSLHQTLANIPFMATYAPNTWINVKFEVINNTFVAKAWIDADPEPPDWMLDAALPANLAAGTVGVRAFNGGPTQPVLSIDNIIVTEASFGAFELQRQDTIDTTWQTIMEATSPTVSGFNDYEARVGILSSYRIRATNVLNFPGPWSSTITSTIPAPGITALGMGADDHVMIFTSNEVQSGAINLAYSNAWEGRVDEQFNFPEAGFVQLQAMYNKDFFTAFHPTERGGERFSRTLLVQAAAISAPTLADFTSLRDMAWADVPYICVRDEDGNRWFATVLVPSGNVRRFRKLYLADVDIIEVTDTPSPVDP